MFPLVIPQATAAFVLLLAPLVAGLARAAPAPPAAAQPTASEILEGARMAAALARVEKGLEGQLRKDGRKTPVALFLKGRDIQFQFSENKGPWQIFHLRIGDDTFNLFEIINGETRDFPAAKLVTPVAGTDLTYEDLALRFFYWPDPKLEGDEDVAGQPCHRIRIEKPKGQPGRYEVVYVWVHRKFGAFMRIRGHDARGGLLKEFQVEDVMRVDKDVWTLRKMQVSSHDPATGRRTSITDVTFNSPNQAAPKGLR